MRRKALIAALAAAGVLAQATQDAAILGAGPLARSRGLSISTMSLAEPTNLQWYGDALFAQGGASNPTSVVVRVLEPTEQGDTIFVIGQFGSGTDVISTIADDQSGTLANGAWVKDKFQANATDNQSVIILRRSNCPPNLRKVTIGFSGQTAFSQFATLKANNILPVSPVNGAAVGAAPAATTSIAAGSITTTVDNCFYVYVATNTAGGSGTAPGRFTAPADTGDQKNCLFAAAGPDWFTGMYGMKYSAGAFNPTMTAGTSWVRGAVAACAYQCAPGVGSKALSSLGGRVKFGQVINHANFYNATGTYGTVHTFDVPCDADVNGIALTYDDSNHVFSPGLPGNVSSSPANTWTKTTPQAIGSLVTLGWVYSTNGSYSKNMSMTLTFSTAPDNNNNPMESIVYGLVNVGDFDTVQGDQHNPNTLPPTTQNNVLTTPISPSQRNAILLIQVQEIQQTASNIVATNGGDMRLHFSDHGIYQLNESTHDAGLGHMYHAGDAGTSYNFNISWVNYESSLNLTDYGLQVIAFTCLQPRIGWDYTKEPKSPLRKVFS